MLLQKYQNLLKNKILKQDEEQQRCIALFRKLIDDLAQYTPAVDVYEKESAVYAVSGAAPLALALLVKLQCLNLISTC